ncbi:hypothetical protein M422DRAFT_194709 [Sphaerobolus stellatus SS14]|uniref:Uncharacterized protein n=1 Tax=Sphaerobolus stellatus (strain SS14) TaxID=990650 RepID=A0A0C9U5S5_SPHS4|nr:hypothetical protein M422DRAFT_194709 [Sphaerobolus stellatus SS14]
MTLQPSSARQPKREPWPLECLIREQAVALGHSLEASSSAAYDSHLQSYLSSCKSHNFSIEPTTDTLSFYVVYMCHHIKPASVSAYLSGICHSLEPYFPNVRSTRSSAIQPHANVRLTREDLIHIISHLSSGLSHECLLFVAMLLTGFYGLLRLGELTLPDSIHKRSSKKLILRHTLILEATRFSFILPFHKADRFLGTDVAGHSLHSGGATALALAGVPDNAIQAMGRWSSDTWRIYIRKHPVLIQPLIYGHSAFQTPSSTALSSLPTSNRN